MQERIKPREVEPVWHALLMRVASSKNEDVMVGLDGALTIKVDCMERFAQAVARECASTATMYSINKNEIHPDIPFDQMSDQAKAIAHATCQYVANAIRARFGLGRF